MPQPSDMAGMQFGALTVVRRGEDHIRANGKRVVRWECVCRCGQTRLLNRQSLKSSKSCGCMVKELVGLHLLKHGYARKRSKSTTYKKWESMRSRVRSNRPHWKAAYKDRGIVVCERWDSYENFLADMGECPPGLTLDRINPDGNYEPSNCRWATWEVQHNNKRTAKFTPEDAAMAVERYGSVNAAHKATGISRGTIKKRLEQARSAA